MQAPTPLHAPHTRSDPNAANARLTSSLPSVLTLLPSCDMSAGATGAGPGGLTCFRLPAGGSLTTGRATPRRFQAAKRTPLANHSSQAGGWSTDCWQCADGLQIGALVLRDFTCPPVCDCQRGRPNLFDGCSQASRPLATTIAATTHCCQQNRQRLSPCRLLPLSQTCRPAASALPVSAAAATQG